MTGSCPVQNRKCFLLKENRTVNVKALKYDMITKTGKSPFLFLTEPVGQDLLGHSVLQDPVIRNYLTDPSFPQQLFIAHPSPLDLRSSSTSTAAPYLDALHRSSGPGCEAAKQGQASDPTPPASGRNTASDPPARWLHRTAATARTQSSKQKVLTWRQVCSTRNSVFAHPPCSAF